MKILNYNIPGVNEDIIKKLSINLFYKFLKISYFYKKKIATFILYICIVIRLLEVEKK